MLHPIDIDIDIDIFDVLGTLDAEMRSCRVDRPVGDPPTAASTLDTTAAGLNELLPALG